MAQRACHRPRGEAVDTPSFSAHAKCSTLEDMLRAVCWLFPVSISGTLHKQFLMDI